MSEGIQTHGHYIRGQEVNDGDVIERRDPADRDRVVSRYNDGGASHVNDAVGAAQDAFPRWSEETTRRDRGELVLRMANLLDASEWRERLVAAMVGEIGKTKAGANGEVTKAVRILQYMAGLATHTYDRVVYPDQPNVHMYTGKEPVGVAGLITSFNFPLAVLLWKLAPALIAGCTTVVKPAPAAPKTTAIIVELWDKAMQGVAAFAATKDRSAIGPGVVNVVHGGPEVVGALVRDVRVKAVSFTGSTSAGKSIYKMAANRDEPLDPRHFVAEMGGQNAVIVEADADIDEAVNAVIAGAFGGEGQRCTATSRVFVHRSVKREFTERLLAKTAKFKVGPGSDVTNNMGPLVSEQALQSVLADISSSVRDGMQLIYGGQRLTEGVLAKGNFIQPTILEGDPMNPKHLALRQEIFGPVIGICEYDDFDQALNTVNTTVGHRHVASLFTSNVRNTFRFLKGAKVGMRHVNNPTMGGDAQIGFGGAGGETSLGAREMGPEAMDAFLYDYTAEINYGGTGLQAGAR